METETLYLNLTLGKICGHVSAEGLSPACQSEVSCSESPPARVGLSAFESASGSLHLVQDWGKFSLCLSFPRLSGSEGKEKSILLVFAHVSVLVLSCFARVRLSAARQAPLSMGFSRQEYWSGLPRPPLGDFPNLGLESASPAIQCIVFVLKRHHLKLANGSLFHLWLD